MKIAIRAEQPEDRAAGLRGISGVVRYRDEFDRGM
jgi:hypothetical protein